EPPDIAEVRPDCPAPLARLVMQCMAKSAEDRPQAAAELTRALEAVTVTGTAADEARPRLSKALAVWGIVLAAVTFVAWAATIAIGLPNWVLPGAGGVMLLGAPLFRLMSFVYCPFYLLALALPTRCWTAAPR